MISGFGAGLRPFMGLYMWSGLGFRVYGLAGQTSS